ncbi:phosphotransferase [Mycolicibacterium fortuitum]|uniref:phosphotransferase n=1 Tax=Mycolicibacterium fortuitum TaxID=1766 RepID=UPI0014903EB0|nr:phosphotransferase family protein [Mycolicibacterium fortuitum]
MTGHGLGRGPLTEVTPIGGGTQNIMVSFQRAGRRYILRRGPRHLRPYSNAAISRETRILDALRSTEVPHPRLIAACLRDDVLSGAVFYLMQPIDGFNASVELPALHAGDPTVRHTMAMNIIDVLASIGEIDYVAIGLENFGKPAGFLERQVPRWLSELQSYQQFDGYCGPNIPNVMAVAAWLEANRPVHWSAGIMHGDFHSANVMFDRSSPDVAAVVDWEMCTIGDPLLDLGWLLATWRLPRAASVFGGAFMESSGLPSHDELIDRYGRRTNRDLTSLTWYAVLACFKLGIVLEGTYARAAAGLAPRQTGDELHATTLQLFERADAFMNGERP